MMKLTGRIFMVALGAMLAFHVSVAIAQTNFWEKLPGSNSLVSSLLLEPNGLFFTASPYGISRSTDFGATWNHLNLELSSPQVIIKDVPGNILAASISTGKISRSSDEGDNWAIGDFPLGATLGDLHVARNGHLLTVNSNGFYVSIDGGAHWVKRLDSPYFGSTSTFATWGEGDIVLGDLVRGVVISHDEGMTWSHVLPIRHGRNWIITTDTKGNVFSGTTYGSNEKTVIYQSANGGNSWKRVYTSYDRHAIGFPPLTSIASTGSGTIFMGDFGRGVKRTTDKGRHWSWINSGLTSGSISSLAFDATGRIYAGTGDGVFRSTQPVIVQAGNKETVSAPEILAETFKLNQNYPNPFNPTTTIEFELAQDALVTAKIYNMIGQEVAELIHSELMDEGMQELEFDASNLPSGVYYYRIVAADVEGKRVLYSNVKKMIFVK